MALHVPPAGVGRLSFSGTYQGTHWANVFHLYVPSLDPTSGAEMTDLVNDVVGVFSDQLFYAASKDDFAADLARYVASDGTALFSTEQAVTTLVGTDSGGTHLAGGTAVVVSWLGSWHYRGGKPLTYVGGLGSEWIVEPGALDGTRSASLRDAALAVIDHISALTGSYGSVVTLGALLGNTAASAGTFAPFTGAKTDSRPCSQRRRNVPH